eukprot:1609054-Prorocentrum_lima.AAC.1
MTSSLVGSEMCIRDRAKAGPQVRYQQQAYPWRVEQGRRPREQWPHCPATVSYTHLTLPTICSV